MKTKPIVVMHSIITGPIEFYDYTVLVEPLYFPVMLGVLWIILLGVFSRGGASRAWIGTSLICLVSSIMITILGWMDSKFMYLFGLLLVPGLLN